MSATKTILRQHRNTNFTIIDNASAQDPALSWKATGIWAYMLTMPDDWHFNLTDLSRRKSDGMAATKSGLDELEAAGYIRRLVERREDGTISAHVIELRDSLSTPWPDCGFPDVDNPDVGEPDVDNRLLQSTHSTKNTETEETDTNVDQQPTLAEQRDLVWDAYVRSIEEFKAETGRKIPVPKYLQPKKDLIDLRLRQGYTPEELQLAVTGWRHSAHHTGSNDEGKVYCSLDLLLRANKVEQFIGYHDTRKPVDRHSVNEAHRGPNRASTGSGIVILGSDGQEDFLDDA